MTDKMRDSARFRLLDAAGWRTQEYSFPSQITCLQAFGMDGSEFKEAQCEIGQIRFCTNPFTLPLNFQSWNGVGKETRVNISLHPHVQRAIMIRVPEFKSKLEQIESNPILKFLHEQYPQCGLMEAMNGPASSKERVCAACGRRWRERMFKCSQCRSVLYCNKECQKAHWKDHKKVCKKKSRGSETA